MEGEGATHTKPLSILRRVFENLGNLETSLCLLIISTVFTKKEKEPKRKKNDCCYYGIYSTLEAVYEVEPASFLVPIRLGNRFPAILLSYA